MGVDVVVGGAGERELDAVRRLFDLWEDVFSRFRPTSELSRVNRTQSDVVLVSELFAHGLRAALNAAARTDGLVDPTLGASLVAAGYDRDFDRLTDDPAPVAAVTPGRWKAVRLHGRMLARPVGVELDLNGVVKSLAVDAALELIGGDGFVAAGGDIATRGDVVVGLPKGDAVTLHAGGVATSGTTRRRWQRGGETQHHLLDPKTGRPARSPWTEVTVVAADCVTADVAAKAAFLLGEGGPEWLDARGLAGRFVASDDDLVANAHWQAAA
jgi:thiamine biosynthesis lipoprotein